MKFLKEQYRLSLTFVREVLRPFLINTAIAFFAILLIFYAASLLFPPVLETAMAYIQAVMENADIVQDDGSFSAARILLNNLRATALSTLYGIIPFLYLAALPIGLNATILGALAASYQVNGYSMLLLAAGLVPHGIFEIPALLVAFACGLYLCREMTDHIRGRETEGSLSGVFASLARVYLTVVAPLLAAAALIEAYVTPMCMSFFL